MIVVPSNAFTISVVASLNNIFLVSVPLPLYDFHICLAYGPSSLDMKTKKYVTQEEYEKRERNKLNKEKNNNERNEMVWMHGCAFMERWLC